MPALPPPPLSHQVRRIAAAGLIVGLALAGGLATLGQDQPAAPRPGPVAGKPTKYLMPALHCTQCHGDAKRWETAFQAGQLLCRMDEAATWNARDKHKIAYEVLHGDRAKRMGERLGIDVTTSTSCTNCHSTNVPGAETDPRFVREENGVTCLACHGAYTDWVTNHVIPNSPVWRGNTRRQKEELFGMTDLWDPVTRATKCASCHIGNPDEQKVVTHAMYAAGHPPLPGLESATFSNAQPRHWQYLREKPEPIQKAQGFNRGKREQTELVVASGIVALRESMRLYAALARDDDLLQSIQPPTHWPDFARFDCYACHHDLKVPSWRQERGYAGRTPGRPVVPPWPEVLVQLAINVADPDGTKGRLSEYNAAESAFHAAGSTRPFGDRAEAAAKAQALADWAGAVSQDLRTVFEDPKRVAVDSTMALGLLHQLCQMALTAPMDYDSARQIAWSFRIIADETRAIDPQALPDPELGTLIAELFTKIPLDLPGKGEQVRIDSTLQGRLGALAGFDPEAFQTYFAALAQHLPPLPK
jgi:hypothetical protein